ncbi:MAG: hydroxyacylglutathione hydrolase [Myxococcota bacterium]|jgi:hydroxyacylglutathione hydrolase
MDHVVTHPHPAFQSADGRLTVHQFPAWRDNFMWVVGFGEGEAAVVDGPPVADALLAFCESLGLRLTTIINTHTHGDHVGINRDLGKKGLLDGLRVIGPKGAAKQVPGLTEPVTEGDTVELGGCIGRVMLTEGHMNGHVSYVFDDVLFCGDALFGAGCGYLFDGPPAAMADSLRRLAALPAATQVCCAHEYTEDNLRFAWSVEPENRDLADRIADTFAKRAAGRSSIPTTIGLERATNPFMRHHSMALVERVARAMPERDLASANAIFAATRALKDRKDYKSLSDADLPLETR